MTAREKFIKRLEEEGLYEKWENSRDMAGKVCEDGTVVLFVHYEWDKDDEYNEIHYPSFGELRDIEAFREYCEEEFYGHEDNDFVAALARWLHYHDDKCPLFPADLYFSGNPFRTKSITFEDDCTVKVAGVDWEVKSEPFSPASEDWFVGSFMDGELWMNNAEGYMVLRQWGGRHLVRRF